MPDLRVLQVQQEGQDFRDSWVILDPVVLRVHREVLDQPDLKDNRVIMAMLVKQEVQDRLGHQDNQALRVIQGIKDSQDQTGLLESLEIQAQLVSQEGQDPMVNLVHKVSLVQLVLRVTEGPVDLRDHPDLLEDLVILETRGLQVYPESLEL